MNFGKYIAHRGLHGNGIPENSIPAFKKAIEMGLPIELDVRLTKDAKVIVLHDKDLKRMCGVDRDALDMTYEEISKLTLADSDEHIPLFKDVLKLVRGQVPLLIEIKRGAPVWTLEKRVHNFLKNYNGDYAIQSFDPRQVLWFKIHSPETYRGLLVTRDHYEDTFENISCKFGGMRFMWRISSPQFVSCNIRTLTDRDVKHIKKLGCELFCWTIDSEETLDKAKKVAKTIIGEHYPEGFDFSE